MATFSQLQPANSDTAVSGDLNVRNNVGHTELMPAQNETSQFDAAAAAEGEQKDRRDVRQDSTQLSTAPIPLIVVETVYDQETAPSHTEKTSPEANVEIFSAPSNIQNQTTNTEVSRSHETGTPAPEVVKQPGEGAFAYLDKLGKTGLKSQESDFSAQSEDRDERTDELDVSPLMPHEAGFSDESKAMGDTSELDKAPLLPHETGLSTKNQDSSEVSQRDFAPLMPHETGFFADELSKSIVRSKSVSPFDNTQSHLSQMGMIPETEPLGQLDSEPSMSHEAGLSTKTEHLGESFERHICCTCCRGLMIVQLTIWVTSGMPL
jgi:hypothetical protein